MDISDNKQLMIGGTKLDNCKKTKGIIKWIELFRKRNGTQNEL
jgi:hypothetical protein